ncbi:hypothetical protein GOBAR_DD02012 [Gossypium barbadense]|nr:hypothetical protein GOBAR_DD02012 [Gossypium barbadense]
MDRLPVWIHLKHVPLELFTGGGLSYIASALGNPLYMDGITASKQRLPYAKLRLQLKFPGCLRNVVIVTITNEGDMTTTQIKTIATTSNSPDSTRKVSSRKGKNVLTGSSNRFEVLSSMEDVGLPSTSVTSNVENDSDSNMAMKTKKKGKIESNRCMKGFYNYNEAVNGRIWVLWRESLQIIKVSSTGQCLSSCVNLNGPDISFAAVYGSNIGGERKRLWEHLKDVKESVGNCPSSRELIRGIFRSA